MGSSSVHTESVENVSSTMSPIAINGDHADVAQNGHNDHLEAKAKVTNKVKPVSTLSIMVVQANILMTIVCERRKMSSSFSTPYDA